MEYPHHHHHGHRRDDDDSDDRRRPPAAYGRQDPAAYEYGQPPPPSYGQPADPYARHPPSYGRDDGYAPPPPAYGGGAGGGGGYGNVVHVAHEAGGYGDDRRPPYGGGGGYGDDRRPPYGGSGYGDDRRPPYGGDVIEAVDGGRPHHGGGGGGVRQQTYRILCKAGGEQYSLAARDGKVCLVRADRDDDTQHWIKDMKYSTRVKDEEGYPAMALINKATGEALKHSVGKSHPVRLAMYNPEYMDESVLWTESRDVGEGFRCIRMVNNIYLNFDALHGDKDHGGVHDGTSLVLWDWCEGDNQRWKIVQW